MPKLNKCATLALLLCASAPALAQAPTATTSVPAPTATGLERANALLEGVWRADGITRVRDALDQQAQGLVGRRLGSRSASLEIRSIRSVDVDVDPAPGFGHVSNDRVDIAIPAAGRSWAIEVVADTKLRIRWAFIRIRKDLRVTARVDDLRALARIDFDVSDPIRPTVRRVHRPDLDFDAEVRTDSRFLNFVLRLLDPILDRFAERAVAKAIQSLDPALTSVAGQPQPFGAGAAPSAPVGAARLPLETAAAAIQDSIERHHRPYGSLLSVQFDRAHTGSWEDSLLAPSSFQGGTPVGYSKWKDSSIWSGHYLAALSLRHAVTGDAATLDAAREVADTFGLMLRLRGTPGLLNRAVQPVSATPGFTTNSDRYVNAHQGTDYVCYDFISRDQYLGVFYGLGTAWLHVQDPALRAACSDGVQLALDYIIANGWSARKRDGSVSVTYALSHAQQLAYLHLAYQMNPAKYRAELEQALGLADLVWLGTWTNLLDPLSSYYKWNLAHNAVHLLLEVEPDPTRWLSAFRALELMRTGVGHHRNAHFENAYLAADPSHAQRLRQELPEMLTSWLRRPRRWTDIVNSTDPNVQQVWYEPLGGAASGLANVSLLGSSVTGGGKTVAATPLPIERRTWNEFLWQYSPFKLDSTGHDGRTQSPGVDFLLPYWSGRYRGVIR